MIGQPKERSLPVMNYPFFKLQILLHFHCKMTTTATFLTYICENPKNLQGKRWICHNFLTCRFHFTSKCISQLLIWNSNKSFHHDLFSHIICLKHFGVKFGCSMFPFSISVKVAFEIFTNIQNWQYWHQRLSSRNKKNQQQNVSSGGGWTWDLSHSGLMLSFLS